jgi:hypothetical protein
MNRMKTICLCLTLILSGCKGGNTGPDVSGIPVELEVRRFERDFFKLDPQNPDSGYAALSGKYPGFSSLFLEHILGIPSDDSGGMRRWALQKFLTDYKPVFEISEKTFGDMGPAVSELRSSLQRVKHYFPAYEAPTRLITFIGPMDAYAEGRTGGYGDIITPEGWGVGLQLHLGADADLYTNEQGQLLYPRYISKRFEPSTIPVNCMKNLIDDLFPGMPTDRTLLDLMVDKGKRMYLLDLFLPPGTADTVKTGYTKAQLEGAEENEGLIWNFFLTNDLLYESAGPRIRPFLSDGPKTPELGDGSPGHIGLFTGRQIVRAYMRKNPGVTPDSLLRTDAKTILAGSAYKPR